MRQLCRYLATILLASFWCLAFGVYFGDIQNIGYNMLGHAAVISMAFVTWAVFKQSDRIYGPRKGHKNGFACQTEAVAVMR